MDRTKSIVASLLLAIVASVDASAREVTLAWDHSPDLEFISRYDLHFGTKSGQYTYVADAGKANSVTLELPHPDQWYFAVVAVGTNDMSSVPSNEVMYLRRIAPPRIVGQSYVKLTPVADVTTDFVTWTEQVLEPTYIPATNAMAFYRGNYIEKVTVVEGEAAQ